ncbi:MAG: four helix bundle protein [Bacteroidia bacterium]|nr:four helix bundle protein [Bacteroidia bacterium]MBP9690159.1 four helix bundle protein [Bacteroidia bacterium]
MSAVKKYDLEERLIDFSILILNVTEQLPNNRIGSHLGGQLIRSGTSPALNYGEAQGAESRNDFIHKMKLCLKELRETIVCLKIIARKPVIKILTLVEMALIEANELAAIFNKSIDTAIKNRDRQ